MAHRPFWYRRLLTLVRPVVAALAAGELRRCLPSDSHPDCPPRQRQAHLEAIARCLAGAAPWLACPAISDPAEAAARDELLQLFLQGLPRLVDPADDDHADFDGERQPLVEAAFLAHGFLRAGTALWPTLDAETREGLLAAFTTVRQRRAVYNNWICFAAMVEAFRCHIGADWDPVRVDYAIRQHEQWYLGDGVYGDGSQFHWDYYNSYVIQPMLLDILAVTVAASGHWPPFLEDVRTRATRYAAVQERLIAPDGSFPPIGRSIVYRCGAFQLLAQAALQELLPPELPPGQVRCALQAVIGRTLDAAGTYDQQGFLRIGLAGSQPHLAETYICTGSCYLASTAFLPLGLPADHPFWTEPAQDWTSRRIFAGVDQDADHCLNSARSAPDRWI